MSSSKIKINTIEMFQGVTKQWYFHIRSSNGKLIAQSEGYKSKAACTKTIQSIINHQIKLKT